MSNDNKKKESPKTVFQRSICDKDSSLSSKARLVLFVLSTHMNNTCGSCWPGQRTIAEETGLSRSTVQRALEECKEKGWIRVYNARRGKLGGVKHSYQGIISKKYRDKLKNSSKRPPKKVVAQEDHVKENIGSGVTVTLEVDPPRVLNFPVKLLPKKNTPIPTEYDFTSFNHNSIEDGSFPKEDWIKIEKYIKQNKYLSLVEARRQIIGSIIQDPSFEQAQQLIDEFDSRFQKVRNSGKPSDFTLEESTKSATKESAVERQVRRS